MKKGGKKKHHELRATAAGRAFFFFSSSVLVSAILSSKRPGRVMEEIKRPELTVPAAPGPNRPAQRGDAL